MPEATALGAAFAAGLAADVWREPADIRAILDDAGGDSSGCCLRRWACCRCVARAGRHPCHLGRCRRRQLWVLPSPLGLLQMCGASRQTSVPSWTMPEATALGAAFAAGLAADVWREP